MGMFHVYLLVMFSCVVSARSCPSDGGSSCTSRATRGGKLTLLNRNYNLSNKRIVLILPPFIQRKFQNTWTSGIIHISRRKPYCQYDGNINGSCLLEEGRQSLCLARNKTCNKNDYRPTSPTPTIQTATQTSPSTCIVDGTTLTQDITDTWHVDTGSRVRKYAYVTVHWKINEAVCHPCRQILTVVQNISETCHETKQEDVKRNVSWSVNGMTETIRGLLPYAIYNVSLTVTCTKKPGKYYTSELKRTAESVPTAPPMNITAKRIGNYLIFKWKEPACVDKNGEITNYDFIFVKNRHRIHNVTPPHQKVVVFNGMQSSDSYSFKVRANTKRGFGEYSDPGSVKLVKSTSSPTRGVERK